MNTIAHFLKELKPGDRVGGPRTTLSFESKVYSPLHLSMNMSWKKTCPNWLSNLAVFFGQIWKFEEKTFHMTDHVSVFVSGKK